MWLADHMHAAPQAELHVIEVCQCETPAVFTSATLPGSTYAYASQNKLKPDETLW